MGRKSIESTSLAHALFSKVQLRLLSLLIGHPERSFHTSEIIRLAKSGTGAVQRELIKLTKAGVLLSLIDGNRKTYRANTQAPIFEELYGIILKTTGLVEPIRRALRQFQNQIKFAFVYGSVANGTETASSDVDVMIVGEGLSYSEVYGALQMAEKAISRPVNPNIMTLSEWDQALISKNPFLKGLAEKPRLIIFGKEHELQGTRKSS
jgi:predicted nucleotidyltransferase